MFQQDLAPLGSLTLSALVALLPLQLLDLLQGTITQAMWAPAAVFEITGAIWLLTRGAANPHRA